MTEDQILNEATTLIKLQENFSPKAYWDVSRYSWGYGTLAPGKDAVITKEAASNELRRYLNQEWSVFKKYLPGLKSDPLAVALLSKGYQYGSGVFATWAKYANDKSKLINEVFYVKEEFNKRRLAEIAYYKMLLVKYGSAMTKTLALGILVLSVYTIYHVTRRTHN